VIAVLVIAIAILTVAVLWLSIMWALRKGQKDASKTTEEERRKWGNFWGWPWP
jgi:hypothetical protein